MTNVSFWSSNELVEYSNGHHAVVAWCQESTAVLKLLADNSYQIANRYEVQGFPGWGFSFQDEETTYATVELAVQALKRTVTW